MSPSNAWSSGTRSFASLLIVIHLFIVFVVLSANQVGSSPLQDNLAGLFAIYARTLNLDPDSSLPIGSGWGATRYHLTHTTEEDDDHVIEVELEGQAGLMRLPLRDASFLSPNGKRQRSVANLLAWFAVSENNEACAEIAKAIGTYAMDQTGTERGVLRCLRHSALPMRSTPNAWAAETFTTVYEADIWLHEGSAEVLKRSAAREVAPTERQK